MDIQLKINKYLEQFTDQRDPENDSLNIVDGNIYSWSFTSIPAPTEMDLIAAEIAILAEDSRKEKLAAIAELEAQVSPRRYREAFLTGDKSFIESIEAQVNAIREKL
jgi:hypothetical protein